MRMFIVLFFIFIVNSAFSLNDQSIGEQLKRYQIKVVIVGPGDEFMSWWGHSGILVKDLVNNKSLIYNFGVFEPGNTILLKFITGKLVHFNIAISDTIFFKYYMHADRDIDIYTLNLSEEKREQIVHYLANLVLPENKFVNYDNFTNNCTTPIRDILDNIINNTLYLATNIKTNMTYRDHINAYLWRLPKLKYILTFLMNDDVDKPITTWDEMFLPSCLADQIIQLYYYDEDGKKCKLVSDHTKYYESNREPIPEKASNNTMKVLIIGIIIGLIPNCFILFKKSLEFSLINWLYGIYIFFIGIGLGLPGIFLTVINSFHIHRITLYNENLLLANPLTFIFVVCGIGIICNKLTFWKMLKWNWALHLILLTLLLLLKISPIFDQDNKLLIIFIAPIYILNSFAIMGLKRKRKAI